MHPVRLRTEYLVDPLAVNTARPRFSWDLDDKRPGAKQSSYEIRVTSDGKVLWSSGQVVSADQNQVPYSGSPLVSQQRCEWALRIWDEADQPSGWTKAVFRIGKLVPGDWSAKWVTTADPVPDIVAPHNGYHSTLEKSPDVEKWVQLDLGSTKRFDSVSLWPTGPYDFQPSTPGFMFPLRFKVLASETADFAKSVTLVDRSEQDQDNPGAHPVTLPVRPTQTRYVRLVVTKLRQRDADHYGFALAELELTDGGEDVAKGAKVTAKDSVETRSWGVNQLVNGDRKGHGWIGMDPLPVTSLAKKFSVEGEVKSATLYATALGVYHATINGKPVGPNILAPEWTDYHSRVQYQAYDVKRHLKKGANDLHALLGDGWYAGRIGMAQSLDPRGYPRGVYGRRAWFLGQLEIEFADGTKQTVHSDESWMASTNGPLRTSDIYDGEHWDMRKSPTWAGVRTSASVPDGYHPLLLAQTNEPIQLVEELKPVSVQEPEPGVFVLDMGQNMVGRIRAKLSPGKEGKITLQYAEMLADNGKVYTENLRGAPQRDTLEAEPGKSVKFQTLFTYHGFRYVQITGLSKRPERFVGEVFCSSSPENTSFECSNQMVNKIWSNIFWTQRANLMSSPTDCPQRDERLGWMGDILSFAQTSWYNMDMAGFFTKWLPDVRDAQADDGRYPDFAPHPYGKNDRFTGVPGWGDAGVGCAWVHYLNTGDKQLLTEHFDSMLRWVDWIESKNPGHVWKNNRHNDYGDWLNGNTLERTGWDNTGGEVPKEAFATMMWYQSVDQMVKIATLLGRPEVERLVTTRAAIQAAFGQAYLRADGEIQGDTQAGYALALDLGLVPEDSQRKCFDKLVAAIEKRGGVLTTGFHSTRPMMEVLTKFGRNDLAYKLLLSHEFPSWGYTIDNGATTIWERWDGYVQGRGFQDPGMNSFNHWALGSVGQWMMETVGGIRPLDAGWSTFEIAPRPGPGLDWAKVTHRTIRGTIKVAWKREAGEVRLSFTVPPNSRAKVSVPVARVVKGKVENGFAQAGEHVVIIGP